MKNTLSVFFLLAAFSLNAGHGHHHDDHGNPPCNHESLEDARHAEEAH